MVETLRSNELFDKIKQENPYVAHREIIAWKVGYKYYDFNIRTQP